MSAVVICMGEIHAFCIVWLALGKVSSTDNVGVAQPFSGSEYILYGGHASSVFCDRRGELVGRRSAGGPEMGPGLERRHAARNSTATKEAWNCRVKLPTQDHEWGRDTNHGEQCISKVASNRAIDTGQN